MKNLTLVVIRINSRCDLVESKPCYHCLMKMKSLNCIKTVIYSNRNGECKEFKLKELNNDHVSRGNMNLQIK